jgi:hypothetical protein
MRTIIVTSTRRYTGKSGIALALIGVLADRGYDVGYFKPYGTMPVHVGDALTDEDALYVNGTLPRPSEVADVCPVVRSQGFVESVLTGAVTRETDRCLAAFERCAAGRDVMVVEGPTDCAQGTAVGLSASAIAALLDGPVLLVDRPGTRDLPEDTLAAAALLGSRFAGAIMNGVAEHELPVIRDRLVPFLEGRDVPVFGIIGHDASLSSVTVAEIADALDGTVLTAPDRLDDAVETFMVGAMGQEKALRFFRRKTNKAVVTGGDRADVQLAALETSTRCIVLTGNMPPSRTVLARAEELGVPMVLVDTDTLTAVERLDSLLGRMHLHDATKAARIRALFEREVDLGRLLAACGLT